MKHILLSLLICSVTAHTSLAAQLVDQVTAIINNDVITQSELQQAIAITHPNITRGSLIYKRIRGQVLEQLIDQRLLKQKIAEAGIEVSDEELGQALSSFLAQNQLTEEQLRQILQARGIRYDAFQSHMLGELKQMKFVRAEVGKSVMISPAELDHYYRRQYNQLDQHERVHLAQIFLPNDPTLSAKKAKKRAEHVRRATTRQGFSQAAQQYAPADSDIPSGDLGFVKTSTLKPAIAAAVHKLPAGHTSDPIADADGYYIVKVISRGTHTAKFEQARAGLEQALYQHKMASAIDQYVSDLRSDAYIEVVDRRGR